ncbi:hypothetical protein HanIR_Chr14g0693211 [Helianthus annuus]|nr:hypothetical protein HanIR_Chr14g0693211 [Helianthus annuus]
MGFINASKLVTNVYSFSLEDWLMITCIRKPFSFIVVKRYCRGLFLLNLSNEASNEA